MAPGSDVTMMRQRSARGCSGRRSAGSETGRGDAGWRRGLRGGWRRGRTWSLPLHDHRAIPKVSMRLDGLSILKVSIRQVKAARSLLAWSQEELAQASVVSIPTIKRLEAVDGELGGRSATGEKIVSTFEAAGVEFIPENGGGAGVRLRKATK